MPKRIIKNTLEELFELGKSTGKKASKAIKQTINPFDKPEISQQAGIEQHKQKEMSMEKKPNSTPLNLSKLQQRYKEQDQENMMSLKQRLFDLVKR